jgi:hypothetical protein
MNTDDDYHSGTEGVGEWLKYMLFDTTSSSIFLLNCEHIVWQMHQIVK